jgi:hypothetical protein
VLFAARAGTAETRGSTFADKAATC